MFSEEEVNVFREQLDEIEQHLNEAREKLSQLIQRAPKRATHKQKTIVGKYPEHGPHVPRRELRGNLRVPEGYVATCQRCLVALLDPVTGKPHVCHPNGPGQVLCC